MAQPLAQGELLYVTDDRRLYIGDGATLGGVQITGYTDEDAQDTVAPMFTGGVHSNISFSYNDTLARINATVNLSNYNGVITADAFKGSVVADDSTILVDAVSGTLTGNLIGNVTGDVSGNLTGNVLGNVTGDLTGNVSGNIVGYHFGDVKGSVFADDSTILVDGTAGVLRGQLIGTVEGTVIGNLTGDVKGSVFADDSTILVDGTGGILRGRFEGVAYGLNSYSSDEFPEVSLTGIAVTNGTTGAWLDHVGLKNSLTTPGEFDPSDVIGGVRIAGQINDVNVPSLVFVSSYNSTADMLDAFPASLGKFGVSNGTGFTEFQFRSNGTFFAPGAIQLAVYANDAARAAALPTPVQGIMVFMQSGTVPTVTNKAVIYDGTAWTTV